MFNRFMLGRWVCLAGALFVAVSACGGRVEVVGDGTGSGAGKPSGSGGSTSPEGTAPGGSSTVDLPPCVKGWEPDTGSLTCPYLGSDGLCYDEKLSACACVCPRNRESSCWSGTSYNEYSRTRVDCF
jgi:hypothetical protein